MQIFFLVLVNFAAHPFGLVTGTIPADGNGLNPLLQYPEMVIHPPMLYLGLRRHDGAVLLRAGAR